LFEASNAVTVILKAFPVTSLVGAPTEKCVAALLVTLIEPDVPEIAVMVSVAVTVWAPAVFSVTGNVPTPFVNVEFVGNVAWPSLLVK
jgi:hypothetical protein